MMIKGRYVATVEIDFSMSENESGILPFDEICNNWRNNTTEALTEIIQNELGPYGKAKITQQYADMYRCDEQQGER